MSEEPTSSCRRCGAPNPPQNRFCGRCGESLESIPSKNVPPEGRRSGTSLPTFRKVPPTLEKANTAGRLLTKLSAVGKPLAAGALALGAEAALIRLGHQAERKALGSLPTTLSADPPIPRVEAVELEGYCEDFLLIFAQDRALYMRRCGFIGRPHVGR